jgi:Ca2+-transporting ATPase
MKKEIPKGLTEVEVIGLRERFGPNAIPKESKISPLKIFFQQLTSPLVLILIFVAIVSLLLGEHIDALLVLVVVLLNSVLGFYQEFKAQKTLQKLQEMIRPTCLVQRDGIRLHIDAEELVPEDIAILASGDRIPADGKVISGNLLINEAILTGESEPVEKQTGDEVSMGTIVIGGHGMIEVVRTGIETKFGQIGVSLKEIKEEETPLQQKLTKLSKQLALVVIFTCLFIFIFGVVFQQRDFWEMFRISIILSAAAIPEGLPMATTIIMALGMKRISDKKGLVKRLMSIETLGSTTVICTDKTGTITEGKMKVVEANFYDKEKVLLTMAVNNNQRTGLEVALWEYVKAEGLDPQELFDETERLKHFSFDSANKYSWTEIQHEGKSAVLMMGAPDIVLNFCKLDASQKEEIGRQMEKYAKEGYRLLGFCEKSKGEPEKKEGYDWTGLVAINDPIRKDAAEALARASKAGIKVKLVTGDYLKTAEAVAEKVGLSVTSASTLEGWELDSLSVEELAERIDKVVVFARVLPEHKIKIIEALQLNGEVVAMTGDGVNDALALKKADIGIAMNDGTEVAKETADLLLMDNSFKVIEAAIEEGRVVFANTKKVVAYVLSNCFADIIVIFLAMAFNLPAPLTILQILWIHIICDGPPDLMLGFEPSEGDLWQRKPNELKEEQIFDLRSKVLIGVISMATGIFAFVLFWVYLRQTGELQIAQSVVFTVLSVVSLIYIFSFKNLRKSVFGSKLFNNKPLNFGVLYGFVLILIALYLPGLNKLLKLSTIGLKDWFWIAVFCSILVFMIEVSLYFFKKFEFKRS